MYYVYLIRDRKFGKFYLGYTGDLRRRITQHRNKNPELLYYEAYKAEEDARDRELKLKHRGQGIRRLKERLQYSINS